MRLFLFLLLLTGSAFADETVERILDDVTMKTLREIPVEAIMSSGLGRHHDRYS